MSAERARLFTREKLKQQNPVVSWFEERMRSATMQVDTVPLNGVQGWENDGTTIHNLDKNGNPRFYTVGGIKISASGREVGGYDVPAINEVPDPSDPDRAVGTVGLLVDKKTGDVLIQAVAEPLNAEPGANPGAYLAIRASVQGSYSNLKENSVAFSEQIDPATYKSLVNLNGGRLKGKVRIGYTKVNKKDIDLSDTPNAQWFSRKEIDQAIAHGEAPFNSAFRSAYGIYTASESASRGRQLLRRAFRR